MPIVEIEEKIMAYLNKIKRGDLPAITDINDLTGDYIADSLSKVKMLIFLEREYKFRVEVEEIDQIDLSTVAKIAALVKKRMVNSKA